MYDRYIVPTAGKIYWDGLVSAAGKIRWDNPDRAPLLLIGGGIDLIAQAKMTKAMFEKQKQAPSNTERAKSTTSCRRRPESIAPSGLFSREDWF